MTSARMNLMPCFRLTPGRGIANNIVKSTGAIKEPLQLTICDTHSARAVTIASLNILLAATGCISIGVAQQSIEADIESSKRIYESVITGVDNHGSLGPHS